MRGRKRLEIKSGVDLMRGRKKNKGTKMPPVNRNKNKVTEMPPVNRNKNKVTEMLSGDGPKPGSQELENILSRQIDPNVSFPSQRRFADENGLVDNAWQRIAKKYYGKDLLQANLSFYETLLLNSENDYLTTKKVSETKANLPMAIQMGLFNRAISPLVSSSDFSLNGLGRAIPASIYFDRTAKDGRKSSYINGRLASVTRPQNERYVSEGTSNDTIASRKGNITEYYQTRGAKLGGLGAYSGRKTTTFGPGSQTFIENSRGQTLGSMRSLNYTPEVQKAIATGNVSEIEKATRMARDRMSSRESRLSEMNLLEQSRMRQRYFEQDLADKTGGIAAVGTQAEVDSYYKTKAKEAGMEKEYLDYIKAKELEIVEQQRLKPIQEAPTKLRQTDKFIEETDAYLTKNQPTDQYLKDRQNFIKSPTPSVKPPTVPQEPINTVPVIPTPTIKEEEEEKNKRYARGYVPNFAVDPMAITEAKIREKREAGPGSVPTFAMYNGKPMVYDARTQTPASAIKDHAFEGGYNGVVKRQFGAETSKKNIVANMAFSPKLGGQESNTSNSNNPVFNINFSPQTTYSSQRSSEVPNFASVTKKYDAMIEDMRGSLKVIWDKYGSLENITSSNIRQGKLNSAPPKTRRMIKSINI
jgi:hypothetical protein